MSNDFVMDLLTKAEGAVEDAESWLQDGDTDQVLAAIEEARELLNRAERALEDGIVTDDDLS